MARRHAPPRPLQETQRPPYQGWPDEPRPAIRLTEPRPRRELTPVGRALTVEQLDAVRAIMRLFVDDDLAKGVLTQQRRLCVACERWQSAPGFILYERSAFCNACASDFETARLRGLVRTAVDYLNVIQRPASA